MDNLLSSQEIQSTKSEDRLKLETGNDSYSVLHSEVIKHVENISLASSSSGNHQKQQVERKAIENEDLVKYMSNLPSFLEKGEENFKEKALNVGVLDWRRLEKWKDNHKPMSSQSSRCSPSSSNSSFSSTDGSSNSNRSSISHSCSPARQGIRRPTLQSHLDASPKEGYYSQGVKTVVENVGKFQDPNASSSNPSKGQQNIFGIYQTFSRKQSESKMKECKRKDWEQQIIRKIETSKDLRSYGVASQSKGKTKIQYGESTRGFEELQDPYCDVRHNYYERSKTVVLLRPGDDPENSHCAVSCPSDLAAENGERSTEASQKSISEGSLLEGSFSEDLHNADLYYDKQPISLDAKKIKFSSEPSQSSPCSGKMAISPTRGKNIEEKLHLVPRDSIGGKSSEGSDMKKGKVEASKLRNSSPTRRFITGLARIGRAASSKEGLEHVTAKCGSHKAVAVFCLEEDSSNDKRNGANRSQSSPLRRLLNPLLKPKAANSHQSSEKDSSNGRVESFTVNATKVKLDLKNCKTISVDDSHHKKHGSSTVQALFQIIIKNGLPLFTFAVDSNSTDVLAATMRKLSTSRKDEKNCWIYTFFNVHEVKKKNGGWMNQGGKGKSHSYVPNAIAQMKVSESVDDLSIREFVMFAVDLRQEDQQAPNLQTKDELVAILVKVQKEARGCLDKDGTLNDCFNDLSMNGLGGLLPEVRVYRSSGEDVNGSSIWSEDHLSTTVILPGGVHGLPHKGKPSPLIERWISGGLCDCGGWDLDCRLRVLANPIKPTSRRSSLAKTHNAADRFELFSQGEILDDAPVFSLSPFKDRIFSVEFNPSLSSLQAFAICIAILSSSKPYELSELGKLFEEKSFEETAFVVNDAIKAPNQVQTGVPASYASYPPLSPISRA
ncbi:hypothetical protein U1Q18_020795 [Sarracenia purpurea var. burkii]